MVVMLAEVVVVVVVVVVAVAGCSSATSFSSAYVRMLFLFSDCRATAISFTLFLSWFGTFVFRRAG